MKLNVKVYFCKFLNQKVDFDYDYFPKDMINYLFCADNSVKEYTQQEIKDVLSGSETKRGIELVFVEVLPSSTIASFLQAGIEKRLEKEEQQRIRSERAQKAYQTKLQNKAKKEQEQLEKLAKKLGKKVS